MRALSPPVGLCPHMSQPSAGASATNVADALASVGPHNKGRPSGFGILLYHLRSVRPGCRCFKSLRLQVTCRAPAVVTLRLQGSPRRERICCHAFCSEYPLPHGILRLRNKTLRFSIEEPQVVLVPKLCITGRASTNAPSLVTIQDW